MLNLSHTLQGTFVSQQLGVSLQIFSPKDEKERGKKEVGEKKVDMKPHTLSLPLDSPHGEPHWWGQNVEGLL